MCRNIEVKKFDPYTYQDYTIKRMIGEKHLGLFFRPGAGKTVMTLTALNELIYNRFEVQKALIIAPKYVAAFTWAEEVAEWEHLSMLRVSKVLGSKKQRLNAVAADADIYVMNRENVAWLCNEFPGRRWPFDTVVFDELTSFKNPSAIRFKKMKKLYPSLDRTYGLTGTPNANGYLDLWAQVYLLDGGERLGRTYTGYRDKYFEPDKRGRDRIYSYKLKPGAEDAISARIADLCISLRPGDYAELPELIVKDMRIALNTQARRQYDKMEKDLLINVDDEIITSSTAAVLNGKLLQIAGGAIYAEDGSYKTVHAQKVEVLKELIEEANGESVLVFYNYRHERERILEALKGYRVRELKDDGAIDAWNSGQVDVMLAHPVSAAFGLNLQAGGHIVIWFSPTYRQELYEQANDRLYRTGQTEPVTVIRILADGTVDDDVIASLSDKASGQDYLLRSLQRRIKKAKGKC